MADLNEPGCSSVKKRKTIHVRNPKKLTVEEMMQFLYDSDKESLIDESDFEGELKIY